MFGIMLALGVDLHRLGPERLAPYCPRLHTGEHWWGARLEVGVEAGLRRIGHDPRRPDLPPDAKQWDFSDEQDGAPLLFECKALSPGDGDGNFDLVEQRFQNLGAVFQHEHRVDALLCFSPSMLRESTATCDAELSDLIEQSPRMLDERQLGPLFEKDPALAPLRSPARPPQPSTLSAPRRQRRQA